MIPRRFTAASALALLGGLGAACARQEPVARSAVLVTLDTTRYDALSFNGCPVRSTPVLDALAREAVVYDRCRSTAPLTMPAHASMLTGLDPIRHGVRDNGSSALPSSALTLAELARGAGLETAAFVAAAVLDRRFGLAQGFDLYDQIESDLERKATFAERPATDVVGRALDWLRTRTRERPFFLWVHLFDPHSPYQAEARFVEQAGGHPYVAEVAAMDDALAPLFDELAAQGRLADTLIVVVADHGEDLYDHGVPTHGGYCYDSTLHVPLFVRHPRGERAGERSREITSVVDVFPTVLDALGLDVPADQDGVSLLRAQDPERGVYFESYYGFLHFGWSPLAGWADARGKYLHSSRPELYDTEADPMERANLLPSADATDARLARYRDALADVAARPRLAPDGEQVDPELVARLTALGYAAGAGTSAELPDPLAPSDRPAPSERLDEQRLYQEAAVAADRGEYPRAIELLEQIVRENPLQLYALDTLGLCLTRQQRWTEAIATFEARLERGPGQAATHVNLGFALEATGARDKARLHYERALELDPDHPTARANLERVASTPDGAGG